MKLNIFIILFLLMVIPSSSASTVLNNTNSTTEIEYFSRIVDKEYYLHNTDALQQLDLNYRVHSYPQRIVYIFKNVNNESIIITNTISKENIFPIGFKIVETFKVYKNNIPLNFSYSILFQQKLSNSINLTHKFLFDFDEFKSTQTMKFDPDKLTCCGNWEQHARTVDYNNRNAFIINKIGLTNQTTFIKFDEIKIKYSDNVYEIDQYTIDVKYDSLNYVFKFIFIAMKSILGLGKLTGAISTIDFVNFQLAVLLPLEILNFILNVIFGILIFAWKNLFITLGIIIMISFIYSYTTSKDIYEALPKFMSNIVYIFTLLFVNPVKWIFEKIVKFWT